MGWSLPKGFKVTSTKSSKINKLMTTKINGTPGL